MKVAQFLVNCFFLSGIFFRQFQALPPGCPAYLVPYATSSLIVHTIWVGRFRFDCTVSLTVVCGQRKEGAVMVFILSKIKCFFRLLQSAALHRPGPPVLHHPPRYIIPGQNPWPLNCLGCPLPCPCHAEAYKPYREVAAPGHQRFPQIGSSQAVFRVLQKMPLPSAQVLQPPRYPLTFCVIFCTANSPRVSFTGPICSNALTLPPFLAWCPFSSKWVSW